jgi:hypothetical protein
VLEFRVEDGRTRFARRNVKNAILIVSMFNLGI